MVERWRREAGPLVGVEAAEYNARTLQWQLAAWASGILLLLPAWTFAWFHPSAVAYGGAAAALALNVVSFGQWFRYNRRCGRAVSAYLTRRLGFPVHIVGGVSHPKRWQAVIDRETYWHHTGTRPRFGFSFARAGRDDSPPAYGESTPDGDQLHGARPQRRPPTKR